MKLSTASPWEGMKAGACNFNSLLHTRCWVHRVTCCLFLLRVSVHLSAYLLKSGMLRLSVAQ